MSYFLRKRIEVTEGGIDNLVLSLNSTNATVNEISSRTGLVEGNVTSAQTSITSLNTSVASAQSSITSLNTSVASAQTSITSLNTSMTIINGNVTSAQNSITSLNTSTTAHQTSINNLNQSITNLTNVVNSQEPAKILWYSINLKSNNPLSDVSFPINATYGGINFNTHNIEYEIEINWDRHTSASGAAHILMGFNGIYNELNIHSANTTWHFMVEHASATIHGGNQGAIGYNQHYNNRFYCGYSASQGTGDQFRYRTLLTGQLSVQKRQQAQTSNLGQYSTDWSLSARTLINRFTSDNYILQNDFFSLLGNSRSILFSQTDYENGHHCVSGTALWELTHAGAWTEGYGGALTALKDGITNINISFVNNPNAAGISRSFDISARFYRVKK